MVIINGLTEESILDIGEATLWTNLVFTLGKMEECTKASIRMIKSMAMAFILGQMLKDMLAGGVMESSMD
jgi:hypothetical protein